MIGNRNEQILAGLMFSQNDLLEDVLNNLHEIDTRFTLFLEEKLANTNDFEEKQAFQSLYDTITHVLDKVASVRGKEGGRYRDSIQSEVELSEDFTMEEIKAKMREVQVSNFILETRNWDIWDKRV